jgi:hypothetical protein
MRRDTDSKTLRGTGVPEVVHLVQTVLTELCNYERLLDFLTAQNLVFFDELRDGELPISMDFASELAHIK